MTDRAWVIALPCRDPNGKEYIEYWNSKAWCSWRRDIGKFTRRFPTAEEAWEAFSSTEGARNPELLDRVYVTDIEVKPKPEAKKSKPKKPAECPSGKKLYPTEEHALRTLVTIWGTRPLREERRTYLCPFCSSWHLTKQEDRHAL